MKTCKWSLLVMVFVLAGCSTPYNAVTKTAKVLWDPDIPVGYPEDLPSRVDLTMVAEPGANPNESLAPTPVAFQIIEMRDSSLLMAGDFDQLLNNLRCCSQVVRGEICQSCYQSRYYVPSFLLGWAGYFWCEDQK